MVEYVLILALVVLAVLNIFPQLGNNVACQYLLMSWAVGGQTGPAAFDNFRLTFNLCTGSPNFNAGYDYNGSGCVDSEDFLRFRQISNLQCSF